MRTKNKPAQKLGMVVAFIGIALICQSVALAKTTIAVLPLDAGNAEIDSSFSSAITGKIVALLVESAGFNVVEREKVADILREQGFQQTGCTSTECIVEAGQLLGVQELIAGSLVKIGKYYVLNLKRIDVASGKVVKTAEEKSDDELIEIIDRLVPEAIKTLSQSIIPGSINVAVNCFDAQIFLNGIQRCIGSCIIDSLLPGEYEVTGDLPSAKSKSTTVTVTGNTAAMVKIDIANPYENWKRYLVSGGVIVLAGGILGGIGAAEAATTHGDVRYKNIGISAVGCFGLAAGVVFFVKSAHAYTKKLQWDRKYAGQ